jgi:hypothetical protein
MIKYNNFLPLDFAKELHELAINVISGKSNEKFFFWTNKSWPEYIVKESSEVICINLDENRFNKIKEILSKNNLNIKNFNDGDFAMIYIWNKNSYIPYHNDGDTRKAITVYLNEDWEFNDGGLFLWQNKSKWEVVLPEYNVCILNDEDDIHATTPVTSNKPRITLQVFITN